MFEASFFLSISSDIEGMEPIVVSKNLDDRLFWGGVPGSKADFPRR